MDLDSLFRTVCASHHLWAPGGEVLPFCQRCTGLYVGGLLAVLVYLWWWPRPTTRTLWAHGALVLQMLPFGYHWLPQNDVIRTATGFLFACGVVYFLSLTPSARAGRWKSVPRASFGPAATCLALLLVLLLFAARWGGPLTAVILSWMGLAGLILLLMLVVGTLVLVPWDLARASS